MNIYRNTINISLKALKRMVEILEDETGGYNQNACISINLNNNTIGSKEAYYKTTLSIHQFIILDGQYYEHLQWFNSIAEIKPNAAKIREMKEEEEKKEKEGNPKAVKRGKV